MDANRTLSNRILWVILLLASTTFGAKASAQTTIELIPEVTLTSSQVVRLGDIAHISDHMPQIALQLKALSLFPLSESSVTITRQQVADRLALLGVSLYDIRWKGAETVTVSRAIERSKASGKESAMSPYGRLNIDAPTTVEPWRLEQIKNECQAAIETKLRECSLALSDLKLSSEAAQVLSGSATVRNVSFIEEPHEGSNRLVLELDSEGSPSKVMATLWATAVEQVVYLKHPLSQGEIIQSTDIELRPAELGGLRQESFTRPADVIGKEVAFSSGSDRPLTSRMIRDRILVRRNQQVRVEVISGDIRVRTYGKAMDDGAFGDVVSVEIRQRKRLVGEVVGENSVSINSNPAETRQ